MPSLTHKILTKARPNQAFDACRDVAEWPSFMPAVRAARFIISGLDDDIVEITAEANDAIWTWQSRRIINNKERTIAFERITQMPGLLFMRGQWEILERHYDQSEVVLHHQFEVTAGNKHLSTFLNSAIEKNALRDLKAIAEHLDGIL